MIGSPQRPVLRYHGGKWRIAPWIISHFPSHRIYVEPFGGAGSVLMRKPRSFAEVYNDLDSEVVNVFRVLRDPAQALHLQHQLELTPWSRDEFYLCYEPSADPVEQARRTIAKSFMAHGSTSRRKLRTGFRAKNYRRNQAAGGDWMTYPPQITRFVERLRGVTIENREAAAIISQQDAPDTLFYVDPPYPLSVRTGHSQSKARQNCAYVHELTDDEHHVLSELLRSLEGMVVVSGYHSPLYDKELYSDWVSVDRATMADGGQSRTEVLWFNVAAVIHLDQISLLLR